MHANPVRRSTRPGVARVSRASLAVLAAGALLLGACGDDDTADVAEEPTTTAPTTAAEDREAVVSSPSGELDLVGTWVSADGPTWEVTDDLISAIRDGEVVVESSYTATDTTLEMTDVSGPRACDSDLVGSYEWKIDDEVLTLTSVSDDCEGRREVLGGRSFERSE